MRVTYRYSAEVNGTRRSVIFTADAEEWGHEATTENDGTITPARLNLETAELLIDNDQPTYRAFYDHGRATDADYDAERTERRLEILIPARWQVEEEKS